METQASSQMFYSGPEGYLSYHVYENVAFLHCEISDWKFSTIKKCYIVLGEFLNFAKEQKFTRVATLTPNPKFAKLFGGVSVSKHKTFHNEIEVVIWELTPSH